MKIVSVPASVFNALCPGFSGHNDVRLVVMPGQSVGRAVADILAHRLGRAVAVSELDHNI